MDAVYRVRQALNHPESDEVDPTTYDPTIEETNVAIAGSHIPVVRITVSSRSGKEGVLDALGAADIEPATVADAEDVLDMPGNATKAIDIPVAHLLEEPIVFDFPEAKDFEPSEVSWENVYYPAERVTIHPISNIRVHGIGRRRKTGHSRAQYYVEFTDTKGNQHELVRGFGNPTREDGDRRAVWFNNLETVVESLRQHGIPESATRYIDD